MRFLSFAAAPFLPPLRLVAPAPHCPCTSLPCIPLFRFCLQQYTHHVFIELSGCVSMVPSWSARPTWTSSAWAALRRTLPTRCASMWIIYVHNGTPVHVCCLGWCLVCSPGDLESAALLARALTFTYLCCAPCPTQPTRNPVDPERVPGGGSAAALLIRKLTFLPLCPLLLSAHAQPCGPRARAWRFFRWLSSSGGGQRVCCSPGLRHRCGVKGGGRESGRACVKGLQAIRQGLFRGVALCREGKCAAANKCVEALG